ncbi:putative toxin-antitoxin system toxin component, PIN family [uncultured Thiodictyon sp.]|uniref:putative toxin-antitoxin system toxin component, PIN family n=1 Tax=uncultured Thiodictyon sp. TaxID=1846217 RepID=UPI0025D6B42B|nr:putative toxin-antitoxin system toxin component, PIN family [uncultured Thiodictyon sp.]
MILAIDTDVIVAALRSPSGAARRLLGLLRTGQIQAVATFGMLVEYDAVLSRPEQLAATGLTIHEVGRVLDGLATLVVPVRPHFLWRPQLRDPNDEMVLEAAVNGGADRIATFNLADYLPAATRFGIGVQRPGDILRRLFL